MDSNQAALQNIWDQVAKPAKDGKKYIFFKGIADLGFLYVTGFVDANKFSFKEWINSFAGSAQKDGSYVVTYEAWMEKKKYRFHGVIGDPFDPETLEEKQYSEADFIKMILQKVIPQTIYNAAYLPQLLNNLKAQKKLVGGMVNFDRKVKTFVIDIINKFPSPTRVLELMVACIKEQGKSKMLQGQKSMFSKGSAADKLISSRLAELSKAMPATETAPASEAPTLSLKDLQKKRPPSGRI